MQRRFDEEWDFLQFNGFALGLSQDFDEMHLNEWLRIPSDDSLDIRFGDSIVLTHWNIPESLTTTVCQEISLETYWHVLANMDIDYSITFTLSGIDGIGIARADGSPPTPIRYWQGGNSYYDKRSLQIPCDLQQGDYNILLGVYNPNTLNSLDVTTLDRIKLGSMMYLTSLNVE